MQNNNKTSRVNLLFPFFKFRAESICCSVERTLLVNIYVKQSMSGQSLLRTACIFVQRNKCKIPKLTGIKIQFRLCVSHDLFL
jgi:hypothetical protein